MISEKEHKKRLMKVPKSLLIDLIKPSCFFFGGISLITFYIGIKISIFILNKLSDNFLTLNFVLFECLIIGIILLIFNFFKITNIFKKEQDKIVEKYYPK